MSSPRGKQKLVPVQNLKPHSEDWGFCTLPSYKSNAQGWGYLPYETAESLLKKGDPGYYIPPLPELPEEEVEEEVETEAVSVSPGSLNDTLFNVGEKSDGPMPFLVLSPTYWGGLAQGQTPVEISKALASLGHRVIYGHPYIGPSASAAAKSYPPPDNVLLAQALEADGFWATRRDDVSEQRVKIFSERVSVLGPGGAVLVMGPMPAFGVVADLVKKRFGWRVVYYVVDRWAHMEKSERPDWEIHESPIGKYTLEESFYYSGGADLVVTTSQALYEDVHLFGAENVVRIPNGYDESLFPTGKVVDAPSDLVKGKPTVVFWGGLRGSWIDWDLVLTICKKIPGVEVNMIGTPPIDGEYPHYKFSEIPSNLHFLGFKPISELYAYGANSDVGLIPFKKGPIGEAVNPIKMYEYLACGLPVVSHGVPDVDEYTPWCHNYSTYGSVIKRISKYGETENTILSDGRTLSILKLALAGSTWVSSARLLVDALNRTEEGE